MVKKNRKFDFRSLEERMNLAQKGDKVAYNSLLQEVSNIIRGYLVNKVGAVADVEDILQEVLLSVHNARHTYDSSRPFRPWLFSIAKFRLYDYLRKAYRKSDNEVVYQEEMLDFTVSDVTEPDTEHEELYKALADLPEKQRKIVELMKVKGYTAKEVARKLDMSESAVKVSAHRTYKTLKAKIKKAAV